MALHDDFDETGEGETYVHFIQQNNGRNQFGIGRRLTNVNGVRPSRVSIEDKTRPLPHPSVNSSPLLMVEFLVRNAVRNISRT